MNVIKRILSAITKSTTENSAGWFPFGSIGADKARSRRELYYGTVYSCIDAIAGAVSSNELKLYLDDRDGQPDEVVEDPILMPLKRANKFQTGADVLYMVSSHIEAHGSSYLWPNKNLKNYPIALYALDPTRVRVEYNFSATNQDDYIKGYVYTAVSGQQITFETDELIPIVRPNPFSSDPLSGVSTIEMARLEAEADLNAQEYNKQFFIRGARPSAVFTTDAELTESGFDRIKKQITDQYAGKENAYKTWVLEQGLKYQQASTNQKDMDFVEQRKLSRDDIMSIFKVPKTVLAISDDVNRANAEAGEYVFAKYVVDMRLRLIVGKLNAFYVPMFPNSMRKELSYDSPIPEDMSLKNEGRNLAVYKWKTVNEIRAEDKLDAVEGGDILYSPISMVPLNQPPMEDEPVEEDKPEDEDPEDDQPEDEKPQDQEKPEKKDWAERIVTLARKTARDRAFLREKDSYSEQREKQMNLALRQVFTDLVRSISKVRIAKAEGDDSAEMALQLVMPRLDSFKNLVGDVVLRYNTDTFIHAMEKVAEHYELPVNFNLVHSGAIQYLRARANDTANDVRESMINRARELIAQQLAEPEFTLGKAKERVVEVFKEEADWRAERIARSEVQTSYNEGAYRSYSEGGMVKKVKWIVSPNACAICSQNRDKTVVLGGAFPSGHSHPTAHPNCSCSVVPDFGI